MGKLKVKSEVIGTPTMTDNKDIILTYKSDGYLQGLDKRVYAACQWAYFRSIAETFEKRFFCQFRRQTKFLTAIASFGALIL